MGPPLPHAPMCSCARLHPWWLLLLCAAPEMAKAGLIEEMMNDALDSALDNEEIEDETDAEVEKVRYTLRSTA